MTRFNLASNLPAYEEGTLDEEGTLALFQHLLDTGLAWTLQGTYARTTLALLEAGDILQG